MECKLSKEAVLSHRLKSASAEALNLLKVGFAYQAAFHSRLVIGHLGQKGAPRLRFALIPLGSQIKKYIIGKKVFLQLE